MNLSLLLRLLAARRRMQAHDRWSRERLEAHQARELDRLRQYAYAHSPFYREFHRGLHDRPLHELPALTKATLMERFDEAVTDPRIRLEEVNRLAETVRGDDRYLGRYWITATSGTSGRKGLFLFDDREWATVLAGFARTYHWAGVPVGLTHRRKLAAIASTTPWHMSSRLSATLPGWLIPAIRLDATESLSSIVERLNRFQPELLVAYPSIFAALVEEHRRGHLDIHPLTMMAGSEVLADDLRHRIEEVWGGNLFNAYGVTEGGLLAAECVEHTGMHLCEDAAVVEVVDEQDRPVPPGELGSKILVTVLFGRTQPLIRYEVSDMVRLSPEPCPCGRPYALVTEIEGRLEEVLHFPARAGGSVAIHPNVFHHVLEPVPVAGWQVAQRPDGLEIRLLGDGGEAERIVQALTRALEEQGVRVPEVRVRRVDEIPRGKTGKAALVQVER